MCVEDLFCKSGSHTHVRISLVHEIKGVVRLGPFRACALYTLGPTQLESCDSMTHY